jgi:hypothetical protein
MRRFLLIASLSGLVIWVVSTLGTRRKQTTAEVEDVERSRGDEIGHFIEVINRVNDESDEEYVASLAQLREGKENVLEDSRAILSGRTNASFAVRHSTLLAVAALEDGSALDLLGEVALNPQPLPPKPPPDSRALEIHGSQELVEHDMLALDALDGIVGLADAGDAAALDVLFRAATAGSLTVRTVALAALAARPERGDLLERARAALPAELRHIVPSRFASARDVPQVRDPRMHLAHLESDGPSPPPLPGDEDADRRSEQRRGTDAPQISSEGTHG